MASGWQAKGMSRGRLAIWYGLQCIRRKAQKGVLHGVTITQNPGFLQIQAQGAGWHAEVDWLMVNDGQKGPVTSAGEGFEDGWTKWELIA